MGIKIAVVGGGISGLSLAHFLLARGADDVTVFESADHTGGKIWSDRVSEGYLCESGVNGFLDNKPSTLELSAALSLAPMASSDAARKRFILSGSLRQLPEKPGAFLKSGLISPLGKLRLMAEPFISKSNADDETLADFGRRRLGREAFEKLIDPMASGVFAGDPEALSMRSCFPRIHELEQGYGSLMRAMMKLMRERKKSVSAGPGGKLTSYAGGMGELTGALTRALGQRVRVMSPVRGLERRGTRYNIHMADGTHVEAEAVALAAPAHAASAILRELDPEASRALGAIPYPPLSVVCTGFDAAKVNIALDAFGFLVPGRERRKILGTLYDSSVFWGRAPEGKALLRTMVGGARAPELAALDNERIVTAVLEELRDITGLTAMPEFVRVYRHPEAIPQYNIGHAGRVKAAEAAMERHAGLYITGNALRGVSVNDCIANSLKLADRIMEDA